MEYRRLGRTELKISKLGFGAGQLHILDRQTAVKVISRALNAGINYVDIDKLNDESAVAEATRHTDKRIILSGKSLARTAQKMEDDLQDTLRCYNTGQLDLYFIHALVDRDDLSQRMEEPMRVLRRARRDGTIHHLGFTTNRIEVARKAIETGEFDVCCIPYNMVHRRAEELFDSIKQSGVGLITFMSFAGGVLIDPLWEPGLTPKLTFHGPLKFLLSRKEIDCVLVGTNKLHHLEQLLCYAGELFNNLAPLRMSEKEEEALQNSVTSVLGETFCRGCKYCINDYAEVKVEIDRILRLKAFATGFGHIRQARQFYHRLGITSPEIFRMAASREWDCPYNLGIIQELLETHRMLST